MKNMENGKLNNTENLPENEKIRINEIKDLVMSVNNHSDEAYSDLTKELRELRSKFTDGSLQKCKLWHAAIGGTIYPARMNEMDLPGNIIENLVKEKYEKWVK